VSMLTTASHMASLQPPCSIGLALACDIRLRKIKYDSKDIAESPPRRLRSPVVVVQVVMQSGQTSWMAQIEPTCGPHLDFFASPLKIQPPSCKVVDVKQRQLSTLTAALSHWTGAQLTLHPHSPSSSSYQSMRRIANLSLVANSPFGLHTRVLSFKTGAIRSPGLTNMTGTCQ